jgi:hypothetical protein
VPGSTVSSPASCFNTPHTNRPHLVLLAWMVAGLLLSETICFDRWKSSLPVDRCLAASWQPRCQSWLANSLIDVQALYDRLCSGRSSPRPRSR